MRRACAALTLLPPRQLSSPPATHATLEDFETAPVWTPLLTPTSVLEGTPLRTPSLATFPPGASYPPGAARTLTHATAPLGIPFGTPLLAPTLALFPPGAALSFSPLDAHESFPSILIGGHRAPLAGPPLTGVPLTTPPTPATARKTSEFPTTSKSPTTHETTVPLAALWGAATPLGADNKRGCDAQWSGRPATFSAQPTIFTTTPAWGNVAPAVLLGTESPDAASPAFSAAHLLAP
ncbi:hypothetical protein T484DRAFT_1873395, partial [Baffinella frigidus]